jgi:hypothetical protein
MSLIVLTLALAAADAAPAAADPKAICPNPVTQRIQRGDGAEMKRLDQLPPAETYLAVLHRENGCTRPILAREYRRGAIRPR